MTNNEDTLFSMKNQQNVRFSHTKQLKIPNVQGQINKMLESHMKNE